MNERCSEVQYKCRYLCIRCQDLFDRVLVKSAMKGGGTCADLLVLLQQQMK